MRQLSLLLLFGVSCSLYYLSEADCVSKSEKTCTATCNGTRYDIKELIRKK